MSRRVLMALVILGLVAGCSPDEASDTTSTTVATTTTTRPLPTPGPPLDPMQLTSSAFDEGAPIPTKFTCDGENVSPELDIANIPEAAISLVLIVDDPDAPVGTWDHWVEYDMAISSANMRLPEDAGPIGTQGVNSWNLPGYGGPCPPEGENHRYFFQVYALDSRVLLPEGIDSDGVRTAMEGNVLAEAMLMGTYAR